MISNHQRAYLIRHKRIRDKLMDIVRSSGHGCVNVSKLANQLEVDIRTVRAHLEVMEADSAGVFMDSSKKQFCTKEGVALIANALKLSRNNTE